jgi:hypothetical protein
VLTRERIRLIYLATERDTNLSYNRENLLDYATVRHLDAWLTVQQRLDCDELRSAMINLVVAEPWLLNEGWWRVYDLALEQKGIRTCQPNAN